MNATPLLCPQCGEVLNDGATCNCGFDPALLVTVKKAADSSARRAAGLAANGHWQLATDAASESLRLQSSANDLAVFVLLVSRLAGAVAGPDAVMEPRSEALPLELRPFVQPVVEAVRRLHQMGEQTDLDDHDLRTSLRQVAEDWQDIDWLNASGDDAGAETSSGVPVGHGVGNRLLVTAAAFAAGVALTSVLWVVVKAQPSVPVAAVTADSGSETGRAEELENLEARLRENEETTAELSLRTDALAALTNSDWSGFAAAVDSLGRSGAPASLTEVVAPSNARVIYLAGMRASRSNRFSEAATLLSVAGEIAPAAAYFRDDALYYEARALHRLRHQEPAVAAYNKLLIEMPDSPYADDAARFLLQLQASDSEGGKAP